MGYENLKRISRSESWDEIENVFEYRGYTIRENYFHEEDCNHHSAYVFLGEKQLAQFNWDGCLEEAMEFIDKILDK